MHVHRKVGLMLVSASLMFLTGCQTSGAGGEAEACGDQGVVRIGYPTTTLINGQLGQVFDKTDVLKRNGLEHKIAGFSSGPPANEAMAAGEIDVQLTSEGPAVQAMLKGVESTIIAKLGTTRDGVLVRKDSPAQTLTDLRGKRIAVPFGTTPYMHMIQALEKAGLDADKDVKLVNIPADALTATLETGDVEAIAYNEPLPTKIEDMGGRLVSESTLNYALVARDEYVKCHEADLVAFLRATAEAASYTSEHPAQVNGWFEEVSKTPTAVIEKASSHSPIYTDSPTPSAVDIAVSDDYKDLLQQDADFYANLLKVKTINMADHATNEYWEKARKDLGTEPVSLTVE